MRPVVLIAILAATGCWAPGSDPLPGFPNLVLWAWERPEDLRFIVPRATGVAFLAETISITGDRVERRPRMQPLKIPPGTPLIAVIRIESRMLKQGAISEVARDVVRAADLPGVRAIQVDYDATISERAYYRQLLFEIRRQLPAGMPLEITALVSWCTSDLWLAGLPIAEAVPMFFRMGADPHTLSEHLSEPLCRSSIGISTDEAHAELPRTRRTFVFHPRPWTESDYRELLRENSKWH